MLINLITHRELLTKPLWLLKIYLHKNHVQFADIDFLFIEAVSIRWCFDDKPDNVFLYTYTNIYSTDQNFKK